MCGRIQTFPFGGENARVIWQGVDDTRNPIELSRGDKLIILALAKGLGLKVAGAKFHMDPKTLRAWNGLHNKKLKSLLSTKVVNSDLPPFPAWNDDWVESVQVKWLEIYGEMRGISNLKIFEGLLKEDNNVET